MKTKIKIILLCILGILLSGGISDTHARFYGTHFRALPGVSNCVPDAQPDVMGPPMAASCVIPGTFGCGYVVQARVTGANTCQYWDSTNPSVGANNASAAWNKNPISITLSSSDYGGSTLSSARYTWNSGCSGGTSYSNGQVISQGNNGDHTLYLCAWDAIGNSTINQAIGPYRHDHDLPTISATLSSTIWANTDFNPVTISQNDTGGSGIRYARFSWISDANCRASGAAVPGSFNKNWNGDDTLYLCIEDWAGNQGSWNGQYRLDKVPPVLSATNAHPTNWRNANISITLSATDTLYSGLSASFTKYRWNNPDCVGGGTVFTNGQVIIQSTEGANVLYLCARDIAGNTSTWTGNYYLDKTFPILNATNHSPIWRNTPVSITLTSTDILYSQLNGPFTKYRWDNSDCVGGGTAFTNGEVITQSSEGDHLLYLCNRDNAGNITTWGPQPYRIDLTNPVDSGLTYANAATNGWQNNTAININWSSTDPISGSPAGRSNILNYDIRVYRSLSQGTPSVLFTTINAATTTPSYVYTGGVNGYAYKFEVCARDIATNTCTTWVSSTDIARIDTVDPTTGALTDTSSEHMLATTIQAFNFSYNDTGAPVQVNYRLEQNNAPASYDPFVTSLPFDYSYTYNRDISLVDNDRGGNGGRDISVLVDRICDQAGNCIGTLGTTIKTISHFVYSNPNSIPAPVSTQDSLALLGAIADGNGHNFIHTITDGYGNDIVPATGISRVITMTLSGITNTMYLDQYTRTGPTSIYITAPNNTIDDPLNFTSSQSFTNPMISSNGSYPLLLKAYTPTATGYAINDPVSDLSATLSFTNNLIVNDTLIGPSKLFSQTLDNPSFIPLYTTSIMGNLRDGGFIEGTEQTSTINVIDNNIALVSPSSVELQLEFSGSDVGKFNMYGGSTVGSTTPITSKNMMVTNPGFSSTSLYTKLVQNPLIVSTGSNLQLSTHFSYTLDSKSIVYNSDIVGKNGGYWSNSGVTVGIQAGIKVIGSIASNNIIAIVNNQFATETSIFSGLSRAIVRDKIRKYLSTAMRNISSVPVSSIVDNLTTLNLGGPAFGSKIENGNSSLMRIERAGGFVTLNIPGGISGTRTLVVKGADLYITNNMYYSSSSPNSILGIVVQKNEAGQGGNVYINPSVTNLVGTYVIDGSIMSSSDGINPIGTSNIALLKNQLYIYGSIVSENTIGGSRMSPFKCPSLVSTTCSTLEEAQKYDLNYLRRYYLYEGEPFGGITTSVIGGGICSSGSCGGWNPNLIRKFTLPNEDLARYPVIVEYNPIIRTNPPIGFE